MKPKGSSITDSLLWFLIAIFLAIWLGSQLYWAAVNLEIQDLRVAGVVSFSTRPAWFSFVVSIKAVAWCFSIFVVYKYAKSKLVKSTT
ncbi:hypothetical protein MJO52_06520 [Microbulbifer variabilis]|uniref:Uncharacterized protein n=1 Tax=Microbulbifer variabilis TaxID=266805 RepID=A0ABY4VJZ3_9GAMM|nr:hypothetical protein [Microbulbifer variabilis]USD22787.1 hypothetical protein MJO52_06520 [Microbulbifer variabilis]